MQSRTTMREAGTFAALAVLALLLVGADVAYFSSLEKPTVARPDAAQPYAAAATGTEGEVLECTYDPEKSPLSNYNELISFADPMKGDPGAAVTVIEIFEPNCPHCKDLHPIMENVIAAHGDKARFYVKPVVFWPDRSLVQAEALYAAAQEGKFFEMLDRQFELQQPRTGLSLEQIQGIAREIGMNPEALTTRLQRGMYRNVVQRQYEKIVGEMGIRSVPAVLIDGRFVDAGSRNVACLGQLIEAAAGR